MELGSLFYNINSTRRIFLVLGIISTISGYIMYSVSKWSRVSSTKFTGTHVGMFGAYKRKPCDLNNVMVLKRHKQYDIYNSTLININKSCDTQTWPGTNFVYNSLKFLLRDFSQTEKLIRKPDTRGRLGFLSNYRNPCWVEELPKIPFRYDIKKWERRHDRMSSFDKNLRRIFCKMIPILNKRQATAVDQDGFRAGTRIRCLPYVYILGITKAGTTDFYSSLGQHPMVALSPKKEPHFWDNLPLDVNISFSDYLDFYDSISEQISNFTDGDGYHAMITADGSALSFRGYHKWRAHPWNKGEKFPCVNLPDHLYYLTPHAKYILLLREPVSWIVSCYNYFNGRKPYINITRPKVNQRILDQIGTLRYCFNQKPTKLECVINIPSRDYCHVGISVYHIWVKWWTEKVGASNIKVINSDVYFKDRIETMEKVYRFLGLSPVTDDIAHIIESSTPRKQFSQKGREKLMSSLEPRTAEALSAFLQPWNVKLANFLQDPSFKWV